jgi:polyisoprenoid-binding protein YceI
MKTYAIIVCLSAVSAPFRASGANVAVEGGTASFVVNTTVPGISVKGKSTALRAHVIVERTAGVLHIGKIDAVMPVKTLNTGMSIRDEHMRRYIFTTGDGEAPDLHFQANETECAAQSGHANEYSCVITGSLSIRGVGRTFTLPLKIRSENASFRAAGDSTVKLSDYGIESPSQFGVRTSNEVQLHFELSGKETPAIAAGGRQ